ncbi:hypothetical protein F5Y11DRAFT_364139 [Daldinia sp. FL1419]|nr:hypothetical protein F5Y11DRAFT_364139 [Daldinia sp. FL1419]
MSSQYRRDTRVVQPDAAMESVDEGFTVHLQGKVAMQDTIIAREDTEVDAETTSTAAALSQLTICGDVYDQSSTVTSLIAIQESAAETCSTSQEAVQHQSIPSQSTEAVSHNQTSSTGQPLNHLLRPQSISSVVDNLEVPFLPEQREYVRRRIWRGFKEAWERVIVDFEHFLISTATRLSIDMIMIRLMTGNPHMTLRTVAHRVEEAMKEDVEKAYLRCFHEDSSVVIDRLRYYCRDIRRGVLLDTFVINKRAPEYLPLDPDAPFPAFLDGPSCLQNPRPGSPTPSTCSHASSSATVGSLRPPAERFSLEDQNSDSTADVGSDFRVNHEPFLPTITSLNHGAVSPQRPYECPSSRGSIPHTPRRPRQCDGRDGRPFTPIARSPRTIRRLPITPHNCLLKLLELPSAWGWVPVPLPTSPTPSRTSPRLRQTAGTGFPVVGQIGRYTVEVPVDQDGVSSDVDMDTTASVAGSSPRAHSSGSYNINDDDVFTGSCGST